MTNESNGQTRTGGYTSMPAIKSDLAGRKGTNLLIDNQMQDLLTAVVQEYARAKVGGSSTHKFVSNLVGEETAKAIFETLDTITAAQSDVRAARQQGGTRSKWLAQEFRSTLGDKSELLKYALPALGLEAGSPLSEVARRTLQFTNEHVGASFEGVVQPFSAILQECAPVIEFFNSQLGAREELDLAAVFTAGILGRGGKEHAGAPVPVLAAAVDVGISSAKVAFKVASGELPLAEGLEYLEDRAAACVGALARRAVSVGLERGGQLLGSWLGSFVGMPAYGGFVGQSLGRLAGNVIGPAVQQGAKTLARSAIKAAKGLGSAIKHAIFG